MADGRVERARRNKKPGRRTRRRPGSSYLVKIEVIFPRRRLSKQPAGYL
jgi:hypothetical protein